jgi:hypothetical protein
MQNNANNVPKRLPKSPSFRLSIERPSEENAAVQRSKMRFGMARAARLVFSASKMEIDHLIDRSFNVMEEFTGVSRCYVRLSDP